MYCHNRLQAGKPQRAAELALGGGVRDPQGRGGKWIELEGFCWLAAGIFWQIQSDMSALGPGSRTPDNFPSPKTILNAQYFQIAIQFVLILKAKF